MGSQDNISEEDVRPAGRIVYIDKLVLNTLISSVYIFDKATNIDHSCSESPERSNFCTGKHLLVILSAAPPVKTN